MVSYGQKFGKTGGFTGPQLEYGCAHGRIDQRAVGRYPQNDIRPDRFRRHGIAIQHILFGAPYDDCTRVFGCFDNRIVFRPVRRRTAHNISARYGTTSLQDVRQHGSAGKRLQNFTGQTARSGSGLNDDGGPHSQASPSTSASASVTRATSSSVMSTNNGSESTRW